MCSQMFKPALRRLVLHSNISKGFLCVGLTFLIFTSVLFLFINKGGHLEPEQLKGGERVIQPRIFCYVLLSPKKLEEARAIKQTWGSKCDKLVFYGRFNNTELPVTYLDVNEGYRFLWGKTQAALLHINASYSQGYQWFLKADDDTFVVLENLRKFVSQLNASQPVWFGYKLKHPQLMTVKQVYSLGDSLLTMGLPTALGYMSGGAGYVLSQAAVRRAAQLLAYRSVDGITLGKCRAGSFVGLEDLELGQCLVAAGVKDVPTADNKGRERFLPLPIEVLWTKNVPVYHWIWRQSFNPLKLGSECCSSHIISTHQIPPSKMREMYEVLYTKKKKSTKSELNTL